MGRHLKCDLIKRLITITSDYIKRLSLYFQPIVDHQLWDQFNALCRGEKMRTPDEEKNLTSFYLHFGDPYLRSAINDVTLILHNF